MSNEENKEIIEEATTPEVQDDVPYVESLDTEEPTEVVDEEETRARANGWDPKKGTKTAREFNLTGELIDLKKTIQKRDQDIDNILKYHDNTVTQQRENYRRQLTQAIQDSKMNGDTESLDDLYKRKYELEQQDTAQKQQEQQKQLAQAIDAFAKRNEHWYNKQHPDLVNEAIQIEKDILSGVYEQQTGISKPQTYEGVLKQIENEIKRKAPELATTESTYRPTISRSVSNVNKEQDSTDTLFNKLNGDEKAMYRTLKRINEKSGIKDYSVKEFLEQSRKDREI